MPWQTLSHLMIFRDIFSIMQTFAESTMNELLGWYGYDKVELRDSETSEIRSYPNRDRRQHVSVLKGESEGLMRRTVLHARLPQLPRTSWSTTTPTCHLKSFILFIKHSISCSFPSLNRGILGGSKLCPKTLFTTNPTLIQKRAPHTHIYTRLQPLT